MSYNRAKYLLGREKAIARQKEWNRKNKAKILEYLAKWKQENPDKVKQYEQNSNTGQAILNKMKRQEQNQEILSELLLLRHEKKMKKLADKLEKEQQRKRAMEERQKAMEAKRNMPEERKKELNKLKKRIYYLTHLEQIKAKDKAYYEKNKAIRKKRALDHYHANKGKK